MTEVWLGIIAVAVAIMAAIQIGAIVMGLRVAKRVDHLTSQLERDVKPLLQQLTQVAQNVTNVTAEAQRAVQLASAQVERADRLFGELAVSAERTVAVASQFIGGPAQKGAALFSAAKAAFLAFQELRESASRRRATSRVVTPEDEESLFIG